MSPHGHLATIYRATVTVPDDVYDRLGHTEEYRRFAESTVFLGMCTSIHSGANNYGHEERWLESLDRKDAVEFINRWHNRILQWQGQIRSEA